MARLTSIEGITLAIVYLLVDQLFIINASNVIPADASQVQSWFNGIITPVSARKAIMDKDIVAAEAAPVILKVSKTGSGPGHFKTITDAVNSVETGNTKRTIIEIAPGEYHEKVKVERFKPYITFLGTDPKNRPVITFSATAAQYGTVDCASLIVEADNFIASNLVIANGSPRPDGARKGAQAVALRVSGDETVFYNCRITGFQDTLCDDKGKHLFKDCYIEGTVDFIFGEGRSLYLNCEIHVVPGDPMAYIGAHARKNENGVGGYSFVHCQVTGSGGNGYLARAWMDAGRVIYSYCTLTNVVHPAGWSDNNKPVFDKTLYFAEFQNTGPGANHAKRVPWAKQLNPAEAQQFITLDYIEAVRWLLPPPKVV